MHLSFAPLPGAIVAIGPEMLIQERLPVEPRTTEIEAESERGRVNIGVGIRGRYDGRGWTIQELSLKISRGSGLPFNLALQFRHRSLLRVKLSFQLCNCIPLKFDEGVETTSLGFAFVCGTFPRDARIGCMKDR